MGSHEAAAIEGSGVHPAGLRPGETWLLLGPALLLLLAVLVFPLGFVVLTSLTGDTGFTVAGYAQTFESTLFWRVLRTTFEIGIVASLIALLVGYPVSMHLARQTARNRALLLVIVMLPFWTSILVKSYAFIVLLGRNGAVNELLRAIFGPQAGLEMLFNRPGVIVAMTHQLLPFMILPVLASLLGRNRDIERAAAVLGAGPVRIFLTQTLPSTVPGILAGLLMCLTLAIGYFVTPALLGGRQELMMANLIDFHTRETLNWSVASAISVVLLLLSGALVLLLLRVRRQDSML